MQEASLARLCGRESSGGHSAHRLSGAEYEDSEGCELAASVCLHAEDASPCSWSRTAEPPGSCPKAAGPPCESVVARPGAELLSLSELGDSVSEMPAAELLSLSRSGPALMWKPPVIAVPSGEVTRAETPRGTSTAPLCQSPVEKPAAELPSQSCFAEGAGSSAQAFRAPPRRLGLAFVSDTLVSTEPMSENGSFVAIGVGIDDGSAGVAGCHSVDCKTSCRSRVSRSTCLAIAPSWARCPNFWAPSSSMVRCSDSRNTTLSRSSCSCSSSSRCCSRSAVSSEARTEEVRPASRAEHSRAELRSMLSLEHSAFNWAISWLTSLLVEASVPTARSSCPRIAATPWSSCVAAARSASASRARSAWPRPSRRESTVPSNVVHSSLASCRACAACCRSCCRLGRRPPWTRRQWAARLASRRSSSCTSSSTRMAWASAQAVSRKSSMRRLRCCSCRARAGSGTGASGRPDGGTSAAPGGSPARCRQMRLASPMPCRNRSFFSSVCCSCSLTSRTLIWAEASLASSSWTASLAVTCIGTPAREAASRRQLRNTRASITVPSHLVTVQRTASSATPRLRRDAEA
mmetsp:Transcript_168119/g.539961  ORF Transcript_168119/g.539961 Transcript_168119/m.539961 type:complete len:577 (-) Transcript_168119:788-2518(-)